MKVVGILMGLHDFCVYEYDSAMCVSDGDHLFTICITVMS